MVSKEDMRWLKETYVGQTHSLECSLDIQDNLHKVGIFNIKAVPLGGNQVLLSSVGEVELSKCLTDDAEIFSKWFANVRPWEPGKMSREHLVWLNVTGVPVHSWRGDFFSDGCTNCGDLQCNGLGTRRKSRFDIGRILISTSYPQIINRSVVVKINDLRFTIRLMEDSLGELSWKSSVKRNVSRSIQSTSDGCDSVVDSIYDVLDTAVAEDDRMCDLHASEMENQISNFESWVPRGSSTIGVIGEEVCSEARQSALNKVGEKANVNLCKVCYE